MALIDLHIYSDTLMKDVTLSVILPLPTITNMEYNDDIPILNEGETYPVLWLIHPGANDYTKIIRRSRIEAYAREKRIAVVCMDLDNSYCFNIPNGGKYYDYLTEELPTILRSILPLSDKREDNFIGGISMGGMGAYMAAAKNPDNYIASFSISGGLDFEELKNLPNLDRWYDNVKATIYGENNQYYDPHIHDLRTVMRDLVNSGKSKPMFYACVGKEDFVREAGIHVIEDMKEMGIEVLLEEGHGQHNFQYYDPQLKHIILDWLPIRKLTEREE